MWDVNVGQQLYTVYNFKKNEGFILIDTHEVSLIDRFCWFKNRSWKQLERQGWKVIKVSLVAYDSEIPQQKRKAKNVHDNI